MRVHAEVHRHVGGHEHVPPPPHTAGVVGPARPDLGVCVCVCVRVCVRACREDRLENAPTGPTPPTPYTLNPKP